eukprot:9347388-Ditylum_brightwellii.AAC.1
MVACSGLTKLVAKGVMPQEAPVSTITGHDAASAVLYPLGEEWHARYDERCHVYVAKLVRKNIPVVMKPTERQRRDGGFCDV